MSVKNSSNDVSAPEMQGSSASGSPFDDQPDPGFDQRGDLETESDSDSDYAIEPKKEKSRRPNDNAFQQQRLKAINPVITAHWLIPILLGLGVFLLPLGGAMWLASHRVEDFTIDYTQCENLASADYWSPIPDQYTNYNLDYADVPQAQWKLDTNESQPFEDERRVCKIQFHVPHTLKSPLYFFYRLENFSQNHRRYAKSFSEDQIQGTAASLAAIKDGVGENCEPLSQDDSGKKLYPCGLVANSLFNDTFTPTFSGVNGTSDDYVWSRNGISWSTNDGRFKKTKYDPSEIAPPPNWYKMFPEGYNSTNVPDISQWEDFQNWMFTSALQKFNKLYMRNDNEALPEGVYEVSVGLHFPVLPYDGKKKIFISQRSVLGGKNYFLAFSWIAGGACCMVVGILVLVVNIVKPRKPGDERLLSWNREKLEADEKEAAEANRKEAGEAEGEGSTARSENRA
ncbi:uncharacterized protein CXQ87_004912 [Candidozyma duobushaemuli]|nr:uncharacterized protein CXQ87_004912 [[Candida] duobushaemulonis]PVH16617.1 hypothetical protein CXQ87_004912 [[Candida] duobushaemulonis]